MNASNIIKCRIFALDVKEELLSEDLVTYGSIFLSENFSALSAC